MGGSSRWAGLPLRSSLDSNPDCFNGVETGKGGVGGHPADEATQLGLETGSVKIPGPVRLRQC